MHGTVCVRVHLVEIMSHTHSTRTAHAGARRRRARRYISAFSETLALTVIQVGPYVLPRTHLRGYDFVALPPLFVPLPREYS